MYHVISCKHHILYWLHEDTEYQEDTAKNFYQLRQILEILLFFLHLHL